MSDRQDFTILCGPVYDRAPLTRARLRSRIEEDAAAVTGGPLTRKNPARGPGSRESQETLATDSLSYDVTAEVVGRADQGVTR